jgi:putative glutamine amidotransferase
MPKPLIGLTATRITIPSKGSTFGVNEPYTKAVSNAGGLPVLIPLNLSKDDLDALLFRLDGILFTGGYDIDPRKYGGQLHPNVKNVDHTRDEIEIHLVVAAVESDKPFMGICRGLQVINIAMGGSLYEHLPDQLPGNVTHDNHHLARDFLAHGVRVEPDNRLSRIISKDQVQVNSLHHQGIRRLAKGLLPTAYAPDGLIEAFELPKHPFGLEVQWHPEDLQEHEAMRRLFQTFVRSCQAVNSVYTNMDTQ